MRALFFQYYERLSASYWFIPTIMSTIAAILAIVLVQIDIHVPPDAFGNNPFVYAAQPDGARTILSAVGGSMIGVAGTVFSVTMATVVFASGAYGPRLLTNFMNNRGNQVTLGTFLATFVYSIIVLRSVRDGSSSDGFASMFVPNLAVFGAMVLAICSIANLIFFIHHVPSNIHISNVIADIGKTLVHSIADRFPKSLGSPASEGDREHALWQVPPCFRPNADDRDEIPPYGEIEATKTGYIQIIDYGTLIKSARTHELVIRMNCRPGTFAHPGQVLFDAWPSERLTEEAKEDVRYALALGNARSVYQDLLFLFDELVEIAGRALSPGVNDPFTAITCMDWLGAAVCELAGRRLPDPLRIDDENRLRVIAEPVTFAGYVDHAFGQLRQYASGDMNAGAHFINVLGRIAPACNSDVELTALRGQKEMILHLARGKLAGASLQTIEAAGRRLDKQLNHPRLRKKLQGGPVIALGEQEATAG